MRISQKTLIAVILAFAGIAIIGLFAIPEYEGLMASKKLISEERARLSVLKQEVQAFEAYIAKAKTVSQSDKERLDLALPAEPDVPSLFLEISALPQRNGLFLTAFTVSEAAAQAALSAAPSSYATTGINLQLRGSYAAFKNFLDALRKNLRVMNVDSVSFGTPAEQLDIMDFSVGISTYSVPLTP